MFINGTGLLASTVPDIAGHMDDMPGGLRSSTKTAGEGTGQQSVVVQQQGDKPPLVAGRGTDKPPLVAGGMTEQLAEMLL